MFCQVALCYKKWFAGLKLSRIFFTTKRLETFLVKIHQICKNLFETLAWCWWIAILVLTRPDRPYQTLWKLEESTSKNLKHYQKYLCKLDFKFFRWSITLIVFSEYWRSREYNKRCNLCEYGFDDNGRNIPKRKTAKHVWCFSTTSLWSSVQSKQRRFSWRIEISFKHSF